MIRWLSIFLILLVVGRVAARDATEFESRDYTHAGIARTYLVRAPANGKPPVAILLMLHGHGGSAGRLVGRNAQPAPYRRWNAIADREGLLLVAPQGSAGGDGKSGWNDCRADADSNPTGDDAAFLAGLVSEVRREHAISSNRVYVVGSSNGGNMALRMSIERPDLITAAAAIVASMPAHSECATPTRMVPVVFINGTGDPLMPFAGGRVGKGRHARGEVLSTEASLRVWARLAGVSGAPSRSMLPDLAHDDGSRAIREVHAQRNGRPLVVLYRIDDGGHLEPSRTERYPRWLTRLLGHQNGDIEMADEIWAFFAAQPG